MKVIGQKKNLELIKKWRMNKDFPRFIIIAGDTGSGRFTIAKSIMKSAGLDGIVHECGIEAVRTAIEESYSISTPTLHIFKDADGMSVNSKNALLKVVEEPPKNAYFCMTVRNIDGMLGTIKSRATIIKMEAYTRQELESVTDDPLKLEYCKNIGQMKIDRKDLDKAIGCANEVIESLATLSRSKLFKATTFLKAKNTDTDKIDCDLFMRVFEKNLARGVYVPYQDLRIIAEYKRYLRMNTINKKACIESMFLSILEAREAGDH